MHKFLPISVPALPTLALLLITHPLSAQVAGDGYVLDRLASNVNDFSFTQYEGISHADGALYFRNFRTVQRFDLTTREQTNYATLPGNNGISHITAAPTGVYAAHFASFSPPFPYRFGRVQGGGSFEEIETLGGIFDAELAPDGSLLLVANPDVDDNGSNDGTRILRYTPETDLFSEVAFLGGQSGGLTLGPDGALYYAAFEDDLLLSFSAAQLALGGLTRADAATVMTLENGGYLDFDANGHLVASQLDDMTLEQSIHRYDLSTGFRLDTIVSGIHYFDQVGDTTYAIAQNWDFGSIYGSELVAVTPVPEARHAAVAAGVLALVYVLTRRMRARA